MFPSILCSIVGFILLFSSLGFAIATIVLAYLEKEAGILSFAATIGCFAASIAIFEEAINQYKKRKDK